MHISFTAPSTETSGTFVLGITTLKTFDSFLTDIDQKMNGSLRRALDMPHFLAKKGESLVIPAPLGLNATQILVVSLGDKPQTVLSLTEFGGKIAALLSACQDENVAVYVGESDILGMNMPIAQAHIADGFHLRHWTFDKYRTTQKKSEKCNLKTAIFMTPDIKASTDAFTPLTAVAEGVFLTRHVVSEPPNVIYPETMAQTAKELTALGVKIDILDEQDMRKLGMNALLGVGQGSSKESRLVVMEWQGGPKDQAPIAFVGKGVTFDTGGISIKPAGDMDEMKWDMGGSGVVLGLMKALALRGAKVNVVGVMGLAENMPDGNAQRPGDVVTSMSGQTIEILNTDAEGRLVLADALWYTQDRYKPQAIVDLATLTGAIIISLGSEHAGLFSNDDNLSEKIQDAAKKTGEKVWRLPLGEAYDRDIDSTIADVKNIGSGRGGGSITAAQFLQRFVNKTPWAHLDIAGTTWDKKGRPLSSKGATSFGVRLLNQMLMDHYE